MTEEETSIDPHQELRDRIRRVLSPYVGERVLSPLLDVLIDEIDPPLPSGRIDRLRGLVRDMSRQIDPPAEPSTLRDREEKPPEPFQLVTDDIEPVGTGDLDTFMEDLPNIPEVSLPPARLLDGIPDGDLDDEEDDPGS